MASRTPDEGLGLCLGLERKVLALGLPRQTFPGPQDPGHVIAVCVRSAHTHSVTRQSVSSCLGVFHRLACELRK